MRVFVAVRLQEVQGSAPRRCRHVQNL